MNYKLTQSDLEKAVRAYLELDNLTNEFHSKGILGVGTGEHYHLQYIWMDLDAFLEDFASSKGMTLEDLLEKVQNEEYE